MKGGSLYAVKLEKVALLKEILNFFLTSVRLSVNL